MHAFVSMRTLIIVVPSILLLLLAPVLLTGVKGELAGILYSPSSYLRAVGLTFSAVLFSFAGALFLSVSQLSGRLGLARNPFLAVFTGQVLAFIYIYIRSAINHYLLNIPLTIFEFIVLLSGLLYCVARVENNRFLVLLREVKKDHWAWSLGFLFFFIFCCAIAEYDLPREIMLSSDPDQHAFFARQIERFGAVPYHQGKWGELPFNYPAGTGVIGYIWSLFSGINVQGSFTIQPAIQTVVALFMMVGLVFYKPLKASAIISVYVVVAIVYSYFLSYGFEVKSFHLAGAGRIASIAVVAFVVCMLIVSQLTLLESNAYEALMLALLFAMVLSVAAVLNPVNVFYAGPLLSLALIIFCQKKVYLWPFVIVIVLFFVGLIILDPYYLNIALGKDTSAETTAVNFRSLDLSGIELLELYKQQFQVRWDQRSHFFEFRLFSGSNSYLAILLLCLTYALCLRVKFSMVISFVLVLAACFVLWLLFSPLFNVISYATKYRLLKPYFSFSTYQYLYCIIMLLVAQVAYASTRLNLSLLRTIIVFVLLAAGLGVLQKDLALIKKKPRADYCGSIGCITRADKKVLKDIERFYHEDSSEGQAFKILLPNMILNMGPEKWLFPVGGARALPFRDAYPVAFFYYKGEKAYTFENYQDHVCSRFNLDWLKQHNVRYLYKPSQMLRACVQDLELVKERSELISSHGNAYFIKLY